MVVHRNYNDVLVIQEFIPSKQKSRPLPNDDAIEGRGIKMREPVLGFICPGFIPQNVDGTQLPQNIYEKGT
jgi:hypothetical protein